MKTLISRLMTWIGVASAGDQTVANVDVRGPEPRVIRFSGPLLGDITRSDLERLPGWGASSGPDYVPDPAAIAILSEHSSEVETIVFLGTWCGDTRRELPRFFAILDAAGWDQDHITYVGLDYSKRDAKGRTEALQIRAVPTFVLFRQGAEIGRIVERPAGTLEGALVQIVSDFQPADCASL